jgi:hypothetical protein
MLMEYLKIQLHLALLNNSRYHKTCKGPILESEKGRDRYGIVVGRYMYHVTPNYNQPRSCTVPILYNSYCCNGPTNRRTADGKRR